MDVIKQEDLSLIKLLLDANQSPSGWQTFLDTLIDHFDLSCCNLYLLNPISQGVRFQEWSGKRQTDIQLNDYMMNYFHSDTTHSLMFSGESGHWLTPNLRPDKEILESTAAYQKWAIPNNFIYSTGTTLFKEENAICAIHFNRGAEKNAFTQYEEDRFTALTPYLAKAVQLRLKIASQLSEHSLLELTINSFSLPVAILNEFGEVISINHLMKEKILEHSDFSLEHGVLKIRQSNEDFNLQISIANAISSAKNKPLEYHPKSISIRINDGKFRFGVCELNEKCDNSTDIFLGAMVYLIPDSVDKKINVEQLISTFKFTKTEAKICSLLIQNHSANIIAKLENKSIHTIREQLNNCYVKAGVRNQLELINLIGCLPSH